MTTSQNIFNQCVATVAATCGIFGLGTVLAWSSPSLPDMVKEDRGHFGNITLEEQSWIGSIATLGALAGSPVAGLSVERIGRRGTMTLFSFPFILSWLLVGFARSVPMLCIGRFISGFCGGIFSLCAPLYIGESVSSNIRGMLMNSFQLMLVTGILFTYIVGTYVSWTSLSFISACIPTIFLLFVPFIPESPLYLAKKGQIVNARAAKLWLQGPVESKDYWGNAEVFQISTNTKPLLPIERDNCKIVTFNPTSQDGETIETGSEPKVTFRDLLKPDVLKPLAVALSLMVLEQASAFNVVIFYCVDIFAQAGTGLDSYWSSIIIAVIQVLATVFGTFLVDRAGRRILLISSEVVMGLSFVALGIFFFIKKNNEDHIPSGLGWLPLVSVAVFIIAFSIGIGPLSWTVMGEVLHPDVKVQKNSDRLLMQLREYTSERFRGNECRLRIKMFIAVLALAIGLCSAIATSFVWFSAFVVTKICQTLVAAVGIHWSFWIFASVSLLGSVIIYFFVPETKGKTLAEIQQDFAKSKGRRVSNESI